MTELVVGCPVRDRSWILPRWFEHLDIALRHAGIPHGSVTLAFVGDYTDDESFRVIDRACAEFGYALAVADRPGEAQPYEREWCFERYRHMATLRNSLLELVRQISPPLFWSLDSDILVAEDTLTSALDAVASYDAVGSRCYLSETGRIANYANLTSQSRLLREDHDHLVPVQVLMAAKLMHPKAYAVDYVAHRQGEDIGWSLKAKAAGCSLGWDGRTISKHVWGPKFLDKIDDRVGF